MLFRLTDWRRAVKTWPLPLTVKELQSSKFKVHPCIFHFCWAPLQTVQEECTVLLATGTTSCIWVAERLPGKRASTALFQFQARSKIFHTWYWCKPLPRTGWFCLSSNRMGLSRWLLIAVFLEWTWKKLLHHSTGNACFGEVLTLTTSETIYQDGSFVYELTITCYNGWYSLKSLQDMQVACWLECLQ